MSSCREILEKAKLSILWFDSLGAKSASIMVGPVLIDPGAAAMQPSYPLSDEEKRDLRRRAIARIAEAARSAKAIVVTHYHYDHHVRVNDPDLQGLSIPYLHPKLIVLKNPNTYINESQWGRARELIASLLELEGLSLNDYTEEPGEVDASDPAEELRIALSKSFGSYEARRRELLERGRLWFKNLASTWSSRPWVRATIDLPSGRKIVLSDTYSFEVDGVRVRMLGPHFHGVEYDRTGWVVPLLIESSGYRVLYTSDLMGPIIEDYADEISRLRPHILFADGPPTYLYPYMLNRVNLQRAVSNMVYVLESTESLELVVYDHHLLRERRWRSRVEEVFRASKRVGVSVVTAAECLGMRPLIDQL
jgi:predicted metallo-beta-lactamase superfamily hydrolase